MEIRNHEQRETSLEITNSDEQNVDLLETSTDLPENKEAFIINHNDHTNNNGRINYGDHINHNDHKTSNTIHSSSSN